MLIAYIHRHKVYFTMIYFHFLKINNRLYTLDIKECFMKRRGFVFALTTVYPEVTIKYAIY